MDQDLLIKYIKGDASREEIKHIIAWKNADNRHMNELMALRKLYDVLIWNVDEAEPVKLSRRGRLHTFLYRAVSVAAVLLVMVGIHLLLNKRTGEMPEQVMQTIRVPAGQRAELILADGTSVWLNAGSTLRFPNYFSGTREVFLDGQAYFNVDRKEDAQPFVVKTHSYAIEVLGTEFDVLAYERSPLFDVSLLQGRVEICPEGITERLALEPGTHAWVENGELLKAEITDYNKLLWREGVISFDDEAVESLVQKLELYFDISINVRNRAFSQRKYTGKFRTKDGIEHILKVLQLKDGFDYEKDDENNIITIN